MEYKEYLRKLGETALMYAELPDTDEAVNLEPMNEADISGDIEIQVSFDTDGNLTYEYSKYCPKNIDITAWIFGVPDDSVFNVIIDTNYPQHKTFDGVTPNTHMSTTIKTNTFSKTSIKIHVHSNKPSVAGTLHLNYKV